MDLREQTLTPDEVVISLSETTPGEAAALAQELSLLFGASPGQKLAPPKLRVLPAAAKQTHAENNNIAAEACGSDIITWFDADDRMHPRRIELVEAAFRLFGVQMVLHSHHIVLAGSAADALDSPEFLGADLGEVPGAGAAPVAHAWPVRWPRPVLGRALYVHYQQSDGGFESSHPPRDLEATHGHVSVRRREVWLDPRAYGGPFRWEDTPTGGQAFGEDVRLVKRIVRALGPRDSTAALVGANLTLWEPSWAASKHCVLGPHVLFDCHVSVNPATGEPHLDFSSYDRVFCPEGTQPGVYIDAEGKQTTPNQAKGVSCVGEADREAMAPGVRYLDGIFRAIEEEDRLSPHQREIYGRMEANPDLKVAPGVVI